MSNSSENESNIDKPSQESAPKAPPPMNSYSSQSSTSSSFLITEMVAESVSCSDSATSPDADNKEPFPIVDYLVEEPSNMYDYIFEPDHNPPESSTSSGMATNTEEAEAPVVNGFANTHAIPSRAATWNMQQKKLGALFSRASRVIREQNGILEYEYKSRSSVSSSGEDSSAPEESGCEDFTDFDHKHHHLNGEPFFFS